jgi:hypothetical protein
MYSFECLKMKQLSVCFKGCQYEVDFKQKIAAQAETEAAFEIKMYRLHAII